MDLLDLVMLPFKIVGAMIAVVVGTVVGYLLVTAALSAGAIPPEPIGLAGFGLPASLFGVPIDYVVGIAAFDLLLVFGNGGGGGAHAGDMGAGGGFGGDGGGGGGDGGE